MAAVAAPYGMIPVNKLGGRVETGAFGQYKMTDSYGTNVFFGDVVALESTGLVQIEIAATTVRPIGVFLGVEFTDPNLNYKLHAQMWTASTVATDIQAYVADDPRQVFQVQSDGIITQAQLGLNVQFATYVAGNSNIGKSALSVTSTTPATTSGFPLRIVGFVDGPDSAIGDAFTDILVMWNVAIHSYDLAAGL